MSRTVSFKQGDKPSQVARAVSLSSHNSLSGAVRLSDVHTYCSCTVDPAEEEFVHCLQGWIWQFELAHRGWNHNHAIRTCHLRAVSCWLVSCWRGQCEGRTFNATILFLCNSGTQGRAWRVERSAGLCKGIRAMWWTCCCYCTVTRWDVASRTAASTPLATILGGETNTADDETPDTMSHLLPDIWIAGYNWFSSSSASAGQCCKHCMTRSLSSIKPVGNWSCSVDVPLGGPIDNTRRCVIKNASAASHTFAYCIMYAV